MNPNKDLTKPIEGTEKDKEVSSAFDASVPRDIITIEDLDPALMTGKEKKELLELWLSIPAMLRLLPDSELLKMGYDTQNLLFMKVLRVRSLRDFSAVFKTNKDTPYRWQREDPEIFTRAMERSQRDHVMKFKKDIDFSFAQKVMKHGDAARVKLWYQKNEGWTEKSEVLNKNLNFNPSEFVKEIEKRNADIRSKPQSKE